MYNVQVFRLDSCRDLFQRHNAKFDAAQKIPAQSLEMAAHQTTQFSGRLFPAERDGNITLRQVPIVSQDDPGTEPKKLSKNKENWQRQRAGNRPSCAIKEINAKIEHARSFPYRRAVRQGKFACGLLQPI
jgi:hypothetical protein